MASYVDFHCHLDLYPDPAAAIAEAESANVYTLAVTTTPRAWEGNLRLAKDSKRVRVALGLHPQVVEEREAEITLWEERLKEARYVGEVGLDAGPRHFRSLPAQKRVFQRILKSCANEGGKILSVHSVRAVTEVLNMAQSWLPADRGKLVLHWFTGSPAEARRAAQLGCYFSVNAVMMASPRGRALVATLPEDRLLTETDGPFTQVEGRPSHPKDIPRLVEVLASLRSSTSEDMRRTIMENFATLCESPR